MPAKSPIDAYLTRFSGDQLASLKALRDTLRELLPDAEECIKYSMPAFAVNGKAVAGFDGFKNHCSYFPHSGGVIDKIDPLPAWCETEKGTLRFPIGKKLSKSLVKKLVKVRIDEISAQARR